MEGDSDDGDTGLRAGTADVAPARAGACGFAAIGAAPEEVFASRGWTAAEWSAARGRLASRGWFDAAGKATEPGRDGRDEIEWRTDRLADAPWQALGPARAQRLADLTGPLLGAAFESGLLPLQSTLGIAAVPAPAPRP